MSTLLTLTMLIKSLALDHTNSIRKGLIGVFLNILYRYDFCIELELPLILLT